MFKEFKTFITRGNVVDLAVAVVIGAAFGAVVTGLVADFITPLIAIPGTKSFANLAFSIHKSQFKYGAFINAILSFLMIAAAIFFFVVKPINTMQSRKNRGQEPASPTTRECPECLSDIPLAATRCAFCTSHVDPATPAEDAAAPTQ